MTAPYFSHPPRPARPLEGRAKRRADRVAQDAFFAQHSGASPRAVERVARLLGGGTAR